MTNDSCGQDGHVRDREPTKDKSKRRTSGRGATLRRSKHSVPDEQWRLSTMSAGLPRKKQAGGRGEEDRQCRPRAGGAIKERRRSRNRREKPVDKSADTLAFLSAFSAVISSEGAVLSIGHEARERQTAIPTCSYFCFLSFALFLAMGEPGIMARLPPEYKALGGLC